jgi:hypothetical protein
VGREIREQLHTLAQVLDRHLEVVVRRVARGKRVARPAEALDHRVDRAGRPRRRALEQHVLDVVSRAELAGGLVASAHAHPELERDDVACAMLLDDQDNAVREHLADRFARVTERDPPTEAHPARHSSARAAAARAGRRRINSRR